MRKYLFLVKNRFARNSPYFRTLQAGQDARVVGGAEERADAAARRRQGYSPTLARLSEEDRDGGERTQRNGHLCELLPA